MAFSFGASTAPAPSTTGFNFGAPTAPTPAPATGFSFGGAPAAPAPATSFSFGNPAPAPAFGAAPTPAFGAAPNPSAFGAPAAPSAFGVAPAPFGSPAPAFGAFGSPAPAPFGGFGAPPAPAFGASPAATSLQPAPISGGTPYSALPPEIRQAIDTIHEAIMKHKRTMVSLQSMAPKELGTPGVGRDQAQPAPLAVTIRQLHQNIAALEQETGLQTLADSCKDDYETLIKQAVMYGQWQIEALAVRRGVHLRPISNDKNQQQTSQADGKGEQTSAKAQLQAALDRSMAHVDRLERMPSPYLWQVLEDLEKRLHNLKHNAGNAQQQIHNSLRSEEPADISSIVQSQHRALYKVSTRLSNLHSQVEQMRQQYRFYEKGENVLEKAYYEEKQREQRLNDKIQMGYVQAAAGSTQPPGLGAAAALKPAPTPAFGFGSTPAPAAGGTTGFSFSAPSTPAPAAGGTSAFNFGAPSTAASAPGGIFGGNPAPTPGGFFGAPGAATPAPGVAAPAPPFSFASTPASSSSTPKSSKNKSRNKNRLGR